MSHSPSVEESLEEVESTDLGGSKVPVSSEGLHLLLHLTEEEVDGILFRG